MVSHTYSTPGTYIVRLTITDNNSNTTYVEKPVVVAHTIFTADFKERTNTGTPLKVDFDGSWSYIPAPGSIVSYAWTFGDGTTGTGA
jgi:PKD repeat protein